MAISCSVGFLGLQKRQRIIQNSRISATIATAIIMMINCLLSSKSKDAILIEF
jgi:hypothetical protein